MRAIKLTVVIALLIAFAIFVVQNISSVNIAFLNRSASVSLAILLVAAYVLGGLTARTLFRFANNRRRERKQRRKTESLVREAAARPS